MGLHSDYQNQHKDKHDLDHLVLCCTLPAPSTLPPGPSPLVKITKSYLHSGIADIRKQTKGVRMWWQRKTKLKTDQIHQEMEKTNNNFSHFFS